MLLPLFAGAAMAAEPQTVVSIENEDSYLVDSESYISASGYYYKDASGNIHRGPVYNVGEFTIDGIFESKYTASALSLFDADKILGSGELRVASGLYLAPTADMSDFFGKISIFKAHDAQNPAIIFVSRTNNPANASFELAEGARALFTNGDYVLNGKISGTGTLSADKSVDITLADGTEILKDAAPANVVVRGDISEFTGAYSASGGSSIRIESQLVDRVNFSGSTGGILELAGIDGAQKKNIAVYSTSNTTTSGSVFMYGNTPIIGQNSNDGGTLDANGGYIYFGGNNEYSATEKISHTFDSTTVLGNTAGNVAIGGSGEGSSMENGADIVVDGVKMYSLTGGGADGASVKGDISLTVKSGEVENLVGGGRGGVHVGNTSITVENGSVSNIYGGDQFGGKVEGDINISVKGGKVGTIYGSNYSSNTPNAEIFNGVTGDVTIDISGGEVNHIRGGINSNNAGDVAVAKQKMVLNGDVVINVGGDAHIGAYDGESILATGGSYASVNGTTTVNISDNAVVDGIIAGGASRTDESGVKSSNINISGGTLNGDVYAGGLKYSSVSGNTAVNISGGEINADVYGGGAVGTSVKGNSTISLTGSTAVINGTLYGGGLDGGTVEGVKTLNLGTSEQAYKGTSALKVANFDKINVSADSSAGLFEYAQSDGGTAINIASNSSLSIVLGSAVDQLSKTGVANDGTFSLKRGSLADGASVNLSSYNGAGAVNAFGGTFSDGVFTAGKTALISQAPSGVTVGTGDDDFASVRYMTGENTTLRLDFNVANMGEKEILINSISETADTAGISGEVKAAYSIDADYDQSGEWTVVFSAYVGSVEDASKLLAWHKGADGVWTKLDTLIDYADEIASITVDSLGSYAISQVPEPAGIAALLGAVVLAFAAYRRKRG